MSDSPHAAESRALVMRARTAALATIACEPAGFPFASLVEVAADAEGRPILLLSKLAEHTRNLAARSEASLLVTDGSTLDAARVTLIGACTQVDDPARVRDVYLAAHPAASRWASFADFAFYRLEPVAIRFVGGFGRMSWVDIDAYRSR